MSLTGHNMRRRIYEAEKAKAAEKIAEKQEVKNENPAEVQIEEKAEEKADVIDKKILEQLDQSTTRRMPRKNKQEG